MTGDEPIAAYNATRPSSDAVLNTVGTRRVSESFVARWGSHSDGQIIDEGQLSMTATQLSALPRPVSNVATEVGQCLPPASLPGSRRATDETSVGSGDGISSRRTTASSAPVTAVVNDTTSRMINIGQQPVPEHLGKLAAISVPEIKLMVRKAMENASLDMPHRMKLAKTFFCRVKNRPVKHNSKDRSMTVEVSDSTEDTTNLLLIGALPPAINETPDAFQQRVDKWFSLDTVLVIESPVLIIEPTFFALVGDMQEQSKLHRLPSATQLPPWPLQQHVNFCQLLVDSDRDDYHALAFRRMLDTMQNAHSSNTLPVVLLENIALALMQQGRDNIALPYAVAATRLLWSRPKPRSALYAATLLRKKNRILAAGKVLARCERLPTLIDAYDDLVRAAGLHAYGKSGDRLKIDNVTNAKELAEALVTTQDAWMEHIYHEGPEGISAALKKHGADAPAHCKAEGDKAFRAGMLADAVKHWRMALSTTLSARFEASAIATLLNMRSPLWDTVEHFCEEQAPFEAYIDHVSLCMLQAPDANHHALQRYLRVERCTLGYGNPELEAAGRAALQAFQDIE